MTRHPRVAARGLLRFLEEQPDVTIEEAALAAGCLVALTGGAYEEARGALGASPPGRGRARAPGTPPPRGSGPRGGPRRYAPAASPLRPRRRRRSARAACRRW